MKIIIGMGKTGLACADFLEKKNIPFTLVDTREHPPGFEEIKTKFPSIKIAVGHLDKAFLMSASELIVSPGISLKEPAISACMQAGIPAIGDIELFARFAKAPICAITGSNAKSTVTALVTAMAQKSGLNVRMGGNIGIPALELLQATEPDLYVLELSSFQLETTHSLRPTTATILNISDNHMDRYSSVFDYIEAKQRIYNLAEYAIFNRQDRATYPPPNRNKLISFGLDEPTPNDFGLLTTAEGIQFALGHETLMPVNKMYLKGKHQWANALAALALGHTLKFPRDAMLATLQEFKGLPHRCEKVMEADGISWFNDSKGTTVVATTAALEGLGTTISGKLILIAGGLGKGADFTPLREPIRKYVKAIILIGKDASKIAMIVPEGITKIFADSMHSAVFQAKKHSQLGDAVLLSPACASLDMFANYEERGEVFCREVKLITNVEV